MSLYRVGDIYYVEFSHQGRRTRRSTGSTDRQAAQELHDRLKAQLWRKERLGEDPESHSWDDAAKLWLTAEPRHQSDRYRLKWLTERLQGLSLTALTAGMLEGLISIKSTTPGNYNNYAKLITAILNRAKRKGWLREVPRIEKKRIEDRRVRWLSAQEWERLQRYLPKYLLQAARFTLATGLREKNVLRLEWSQVDLKRKVAWIHPDQAKARKAIGVPLNSDAVRVIQEQSALHPRWVFPLAGIDRSDFPGDAPPSRASNKAWYTALRKADLVGFRWHDLRRTWACWHVANGTPLHVLRELGGWKDMSSVLIYAHLAPEHLARAAAAVKPIRRKA